jgi:hypothetical protein
LQLVNVKGKQMQIAFTLKKIIIIYQFYYNYSYNGYVIVHGEGNETFLNACFQILILLSKHVINPTNETYGEIIYYKNKIKRGGWGWKVVTFQTFLNTFTYNLIQWVYKLPTYIVSCLQHL